MRWFKVAAAVVGVVIVFMVVSSLIGFLVEAAIAVLVVAVIALAVKVAVSRRQVSWKRPKTEIRGSGDRRNIRGIDDELDRLRRETGGSQL